MRQVTQRPTAVFDLDGVISKNPDEALVQTTTDPELWTNHWSDVDGTRMNYDVLAIMHGLHNTGWTILVLTARPLRFANETIRLLREKAGFSKARMWIGDHVHQSFDDAFAPQEAYGNVILKMYDVAEIPSSSGEWKASVLKGIIEAGVDVQFMMEDYKPNAEAIRKLVPVYLYERVK